MANYLNYSFSFSKGEFYQKAKTPTEGYTEVLYGTNKDQKTYHKYERTVKGVLSKVDTKEVEYEGRKLRFLEVELKDGDNEVKISVPLKNTKSNYTDEVKGLVSGLYGADFGEEVTITPNKSTTKGANGKEYTNIGFYVNYVNRLGENGKGLSTGFIQFADIPKPIKEEEDGEVYYDWKPVNKFWNSKIVELKERDGSNSEQPKQEAPKAENKKEDKRDNLPF